MTKPGSTERPHDPGRDGGDGVRPVRVGDPAPDFTLPDQSGLLIALRQFRGRTVILYFYPRDHTVVCTTQACDFRDNYEVFRRSDAEILGISSDSAASHATFADQHGLPFTLLSDPGGLVRARYGVPRFLGLFPGRVTYVIDRDGIVRQIIRSAFSATRHVRAALRAARVLQKDEPRKPIA